MINIPNGSKNCVYLVGRLVADPETLEVKDSKVTRFRVAVAREASDGADFVACEVWNSNADPISEAKKGQSVQLRGRLRQNSWKDSQGEPRSRLVVRADEIEMI